MKSFASLIPAMGLIAAAQAWTNETLWTTVTVQTLTTYCPEATTLTHGTKTYTATAHETLTITDCPCTVSHPVQPTHTPYVPHPPPKNETAIYVTTTVSEFTTYCPAPTTIAVGHNSTITVVAPTTLTVTACPCTLTRPGVVTTTISQLTTYCPAPTTITIGTVTHPVTTPGTVVIPVEHVTTVPVPETTAPVVVEPTKATGTGALPVGPSATPSGPLEANSAIKQGAGVGAIVAAGFAAFFL